MGLWGTAVVDEAPQLPLLLLLLLLLRRPLLLRPLRQLRKLLWGTQLHLRTFLCSWFGVADACTSEANAANIGLVAEGDLQRLCEGPQTLGGKSHINFELLLRRQQAPRRFALKGVPSFDAEVQLSRAAAVEQQQNLLLFVPHYATRKMKGPRRYLQPRKPQFKTPSEKLMMKIRAQ